MMKKKKIYTLFLHAMRVLFLLYSYVSKKKYVMFIPHIHMCMNDLYSIINYKSDSALSFANYILTNDLLKDKIVALGVSETNDINLIRDYLKIKFPLREIELVYPFGMMKYNPSNLKKSLIFYKKMASSSHVFTSQTPTYRPLAKSSKIKMINLGYYVAPIKDSTHDSKNKLYLNYQSIDKNDFDYYMVTSEVSKRLIMATYGLQYSQFKIMGMCRNDYLFTSETPVSLKEQILSAVPYDVNKILLYTPTHRDNLSSIKQFNRASNIFGFETDLKKIDAICKREKIFIICKIHPKQYNIIKKQELPSCVGLFEPNNQYGLAELMKISDALVTDYTSGYFDYLILDKPVIFNLYDVDEYKSTRGLIFNPIEPICAGDIVHDEKEFIDALLNIEQNRVKYREKRKIVRDMLNYYQDSNTCKRVYEFYFAK